MADNELPGAINGRLSRVRAMESQLVDRLEQLRTAGALEPEEREAFTRRSALAARHVLALEEVAGQRVADRIGQQSIAEIVAVGFQIAAVAVVINAIAGGVRFLRR